MRTSFLLPPSRGEMARRNDEFEDNMYNQYRACAWALQRAHEKKTLGELDSDRFKDMAVLLRMGLKQMEPGPIDTKQMWKDIGRRKDHGEQDAESTLLRLGHNQSNLAKEFEKLRRFKAWKPKARKTTKAKLERLVEILGHMAETAKESGVVDGFREEVPILHDFCEAMTNGVFQGGFHGVGCGGGNL